jgi:hypothetical protein
MQGDLKAARLVGYARLQRVGNCVAYEDLIGHRDFMNDGIMKLLHCHILHWLLDSGDPDVQGLEYVVHGSIERGNDGIFFWKKKALFMPYLIELVATELPEDFVEEEYLRLNPDVKASGLDGSSHYRLYGQKEGRHYQSEDRRDASQDQADLRDEHPNESHENPQESRPAEHGLDQANHQPDVGAPSAPIPPEVRQETNTETPDSSIAQNINPENTQSPNAMNNSKPS